MKQRWPFERPAPTLVTTRRSGGGIVIGRKLPPGEEADPSHGGWTIRASGSGTAPGGVEWIRDQPAMSITSRVGGPGARTDRPRALNDDGNGVRITLAEALILQDFSPDYPVQGTNTARFLQVGNAIPPGLARAILSVLVG